ncbi:MAG: hypothetical protein GX299_05915 [Epulopiscium sp.]|nr:hypothetical protein [Candidatus Epulonipiscium sp.]
MKGVDDFLMGEYTIQSEMFFMHILMKIFGGEPIWTAVEVVAAMVSRCGLRAYSIIKNTMPNIWGLSRYLSLLFKSLSFCLSFGIKVLQGLFIPFCIFYNYAAEK